MNKITVDFHDEIYSLNYLDNEITFNNNIIYIYNLEKPYDYHRLKDFSILNNYKRYIIFSWVFRDDKDIINKLKYKFDLKLIDYSLECFWYCYILDNKIEENLDLGNKKLYINLTTDIFQNNKYNKNLELVKEKFENYKKNILNYSVKKLHSLFYNIQGDITSFENYMNRINKNVSIINSIDLKGNYLEDRENQLSLTRKLRDKNIELENKIEILTDKINNLNETYDNLIKENKFINVPINLGIKKKWKDFAIFIHLYNISLWEEIYSFVKNLEPFKLNIDLYVNIATNETGLFDTKVYIDLEKKIKNCRMFHNIYITHSDNRGMDIGGFFISYIKMLDLGNRYHQIIKIHSKTNDNWRYAMLYGLLGNYTIINNNFNLMKRTEVGMLGNDKMSLNYILNINKKSYRYIWTYLKYFNIKNIDSYGYFIPGTIFWIKGEVLDNFFTKEILIKCYSEFTQNYCGSLINNREGKPHAFERFFGVLVEKSGKKVVTFDEKL